MAELHKKLGLREIINVSGTMTGLGASIAIEPVGQAMMRILPQFVEIHDLQRKASDVIARLTGAEAGFVTASCSAGITLAIAGCMSGASLAIIERLPDTNGLKNEVVIQMGHVINYGAPVEQAIRLCGAQPRIIGQATSCHDYHLEGAIGSATAAALYVVSHHVVEYGLLSLARFVRICHARGVPVIVDAASEYDLRGFLAAGADIVLYSGHKFLGGPTSGLVAGKKALVTHAYLQNIGIGRVMKVGKESIYGVMIALEAWEKRDHKAIAVRERQTLELWRDALIPFAGIRPEILPDPTGNPLERLRVTIDARLSNITAWDLADALAAGEPPIIVRDHEIEHHYFTLDPCNLHEGQAQLVARCLTQELEKARCASAPIATPLEERFSKVFDKLCRWPD